VTVYGSQFCDQASPQAFCSQYTSQGSICFAYPGTTLVGDNAFIDGFSLNEESCSVESNSLTLYYHSVGDFTEWINEVSGGTMVSTSSTTSRTTTSPGTTTPSGATMVIKISIFTLVSAMLISFAGFM
jgi:hypothetical protein